LIVARLQLLQQSIFVEVFKLRQVLRLAHLFS
jgi:hypothetical protein